MKVEQIVKLLKETLTIEEKKYVYGALTDVGAFSQLMGDPDYAAGCASRPFTGERSDNQWIFLTIENIAEYIRSRRTNAEKEFLRGAIHAMEHPVDNKAFGEGYNGKLFTGERA